MYAKVAEITLVVGGPVTGVRHEGPVVSLPDSHDTAAPMPPRTASRRTGWLALIVVAVLLVGVGGTVLVLNLSGAFGTAVQAEPVRASGENPFMPSVGQDTPVTAPPNTGRSVTADTAGLYGGTMNRATCDPDKMAAFLQANPEKAAAWADVEGIPVADVARYIRELTPLILRSDTRVTNHGFADGRATNRDSVLESGTAVLVDRSGVPRAKCECGNPLTPPRNYSRERVVGPTWPTFSQTNITIINQSVTVINQFVIIDVVNNQIIYRPAGTRGGDDRGRLEDADIAGTYTLTGRPISCSGFEYGCRSGTLEIQIGCSGGQCTISRPDGGWAREHPLTGDGASWRTSGPDEGATNCNGENRPATISLSLTIVSAATVNGAWKAQKLQGVYSYSATAVSDCNGGDGSFDVSN